MKCLRVVFAMSGSDLIYTVLNSSFSEGSDLIYTCGPIPLLLPQERRLALQIKYFVYLVRDADEYLESSEHFHFFLRREICSVTVRLLTGLWRGEWSQYESGLILDDNQFTKQKKNQKKLIWCHHREFIKINVRLCNIACIMKTGLGNLRLMSCKRLPYDLYTLCWHLLYFFVWKPMNLAEDLHLITSPIPNTVALPE